MWVTMCGRQTGSVGQDLRGEEGVTLSDNKDVSRSESEPDSAPLRYSWVANLSDWVKPVTTGVGNEYIQPVDPVG